MKTITMTFRIPRPLAVLLQRAASKPLSPTMTAIVVRGISLALRELARKPR